MQSIFNEGRKRQDQTCGIEGQTYLTGVEPDTECEVRGQVPG